MAHLKQTFQGFYRTDKGSTPTFHSRTEIRMATPTSRNGLFPKALKTVSPYIAFTLSRIFNLSLKIFQIPDDWRHAIVTPVAKTPRTADPNLFRPISLTSVICKVLEAILNDKLLAHLSQFSLWASRQHGFLPQCSTLTNLLVAEDLITKWLDEGSAVELIYQDFFNAFDSVNHRLLLHKRRGYGIAPL